MILANTDVVRSAHVDTFCAERMPACECLPVMFRDLPEYLYASRLNCAAELLDRIIAHGQGHRVAFLHESGCWSYQRLFEIANRVAHVLREDLGVVPGNRVLLRGPNHPMLAACWLAVLKAGAVAVTTSSLLRSREIVFIADKAQISVGLCDARFATDCEEAFARHQDGSVRSSSLLVCFNSDAAGSLESLMANKPPQFQNCDTSAEDVAIVAFTSGTTGRAKGAMHTHRDLLAAADAFPRHVVRPNCHDIFIGTPPLGFTYALGGLLLFPMRVGASSALLEHNSPRHLLEGIARYRATVCFTAPTAYRAMLKEPALEQTRSLRKCISAGEALPLATYEGWREATGVKIIDGIGSTEMLHMFISAADDEIRPGAIGKAIQGYEAKVVRSDGTGATANEVGRLAVRGVTGCKYLDDPEEQAKYVQDGWNFTGDSFRKDEDGYFWFQSRTDDLIVSSGYNISGIEVESVLLEHPAVQECGVIGVPDSDRGQVVKAFIVVTPGFTPSDQLKGLLQDFVKAQIAPYKYPRAIEFLSALPRTATGKLQRFRLREAVK